MIVNSPNKNDFSNVRQIGIIITTYADNAKTNHIGIVYKLGEEAPSMLHFDVPLIEGNIPCESEYLWLDLGDDFTDIDRTIICMHAKKVADVNDKKSLAYGYDTPGGYIDGETGKVTPVLGDFGLTCATFVLEVFKSCGYSVIDIDSWPRSTQEDQEWQRNMLWWQKGSREDIETEIIARQVKNIGKSRFLPEQVAAATQGHRPVCYGATLRQAKIIRKHLVAHRFSIKSN